MAKLRRLIDDIRSFSPSREIWVGKLEKELPETVQVDFTGGQIGRLNMRNPRQVHWAHVIDRMNQARRPVYVEIDPDTEAIVQLLIPETAIVHALDTNAKGNVEVKLIPSQAIHYVLRKNPDFDKILSMLKSALDEKSEILVTKTRDKHEIIDVRIPPKETGRTNSPPPNVPDDPPVSEQRAKDIFDLMNNRSCTPCTASPPCIPFLYPDDGCFARAHEMCRLMLNEAEAPEKIWIYGSLKVKTANHPDCEVNWWYHVAPTLSVSISGKAERRVIDPALSSEPLTETEWKKLQGDPAATFDYTNANPFWPNGGTDPDYSLTNTYLQYYRDRLIDRCLELGPPPYSQCCFIATAAYGSPYAPQVQRLRLIRDQQLKTTVFGNALVSGFEKWYYSFSPLVAKAMNRSPSLRRFMRRFIVNPIVVFFKLLFDR